MIEATTSKGTKVYVTATDDCGDNKGGLYCQIYADENIQRELDNFVIHREWLDEADADTLIKEHVHAITEY